MNMETKHVVVTVDDANVVNIRQIAQQLGGKGLAVDRILPITGVITGSCMPGGLAKLREVGGVSSIEMDAAVHLLSPAPAVGRTFR